EIEERFVDPLREGWVAAQQLVDPDGVAGGHRLPELGQELIRIRGFAGEALEGTFQLRPALEALLPGDDALGCVQGGVGRRPLESLKAVPSFRVGSAIRLQELLRLLAVLLQARIWGKRARGTRAGHNNLLSGCAWRPQSQAERRFVKRSRTRRGGHGPFRG